MYDNQDRWVMVESSDRMWSTGDGNGKPLDILALNEYVGFPGGSDGKESACNAGDLGSLPGLGRSPGGGHGNPLQDSCLESPHVQKSLVGYSPWGCKELDTTEQLSTDTHIN